jgi:hypothetical protein
MGLHAISVDTDEAVAGACEEALAPKFRPCST